MDNSNAACSHCGDAFVCDAADRPSECWCQSYPAVLPLEDKAACLCAKCLKLRVVDALPDYLKLIGHEKSLALAEHYSIDGKPEEGIDYQMEDGLLVFSAWYHLKRGNCCGNGCRHCPYPKEGS